MSEAAPKYVDGWARQNEIRRAHEENIKSEAALIGTVDGLSGCLTRLTQAINRLAEDLERRSLK